MSARDFKDDRSLRFRVQFDTKPNRELEVMAYAFGGDGELMASAPVKEGMFDLPSGAVRGHGTRLFIGPRLEKQEPTVQLMERIQAYQPVMHFDPQQIEHQLLPIPTLNWQYWWPFMCRVRGQVVKPVTIGAVTANMPVCHARVHICEVDPLILYFPKLPIDVIVRLRDDLLDLIRPHIPVPPKPEPDPAPWRRNVVSDIQKQAHVMAQAEIAGHTHMMAAITRPGHMTADDESSMFMDIGGMEGLTMHPDMFAKSLAAALPIEAIAKLQSDNVQVLRQSMVDMVVHLRPYLCEFRWLWPYLLRCTEIRTVVTDHAGRFDTLINYWPFGDRPDLYFWVEYSVGGSWTTVYRRPLACDTYWNYTCGTEVTLTVTDHRVSWCGEPPSVNGMKVAIISVGDGVSVSQIGTMGTAEGLAPGARPFGGSLEPHVWFGRHLIANGVTHYRWRYRKMGTLTWHTADQEVVRHYAVELPDMSLIFKPAVMGPEGPAQLFQIQPQTAPEGGDWAPAVNSRLNTASAYFRSDTLGNTLAAAGKYEMKLELFDSAGNQIDPDAMGIEFVVPNPSVNAPFTDVVPMVTAPAYNLMTEGGHKAFRMVLHVDNNPCEAEIFPVTVNGVAAGTCGFVSYHPGDNVSVSFKARHPNDFASFGFAISRGSAGTMESAGGSVGNASVMVAASGSMPAHTYTRNAGSVFTSSVPSAGLLAGCPAGKGAFAETLYVAAMATDGFSTLTYLDRAGTPTAFALDPATM